MNNKFFKKLSIYICVALGLSLTGCANKSKTSVTVASYNVQCLSYGSELNQIAEEIKTLNPDIIGLQELDSFTNRCGGFDQIKLLAETAGYKYYYFTKTIDFDGGEYGHGIMSKYPITNYETIPFDNQDSENRCFSRSVIKVNGRRIVFYNTHLEYMGNIQTKQISEIVKMTKKDKYFVITGDMNCTPQHLKASIDSERMIMLNGGESGNKVVNTCPEGENSRQPIDNITISNNFRYQINKENDIGLFVNKTNNSDHNMIYANLDF